MCRTPPPSPDYSRMFRNLTRPHPSEIEEHLHLHFDNLKDWTDLKFFKIDQKIDDRLDKSDRRLDLLTLDVTNLRAAFDSFRVLVAQPTSTTSAYTSSARIPLASMMATPPTPRMDQFHHLHVGHPVIAEIRTF